MRYITVEDLSFYYDKEPVPEHINYSVDSGEFVTLTGEKWSSQDNANQGQPWNSSKPRIGKSNHLKDKYSWEKLRIAYPPQQIASFNAGFPRYCL